MKSIAFIPALMLLLTTGALGRCPQTTEAQDSTWTKIPGSLKQVTASVHYLWGVYVNDDVYRCARPCTGEWIHVPGKLKQVDAGDMEVWGVDNANEIWKRPVDGSGDWVRVSGSMTHVSASGNGYIWGVNENVVGPVNNAYKCKKPCAGDWEETNGKLRQIDGGFDYVYAINDIDRIFRMEVVGPGNWHQIPGTMDYITGSGRDEVFAVDIANHIYSCKKPCDGEWKQIDGSLKQIDATVDAVFGVNRNDDIFGMKLPY